MNGIVHIGMGSNVGDAYGNCLSGARNVITHKDVHFLALSSFYRT